MSAAPRLREVQELFWRLITAPEGVQPALADLAREGRFDPQVVGTLFSGDDAVGAVERLDIYANMYFYRLLDCLREDFPLTAAALGTAGFNDLVTDFLLRHPSRHPSLRELGRPFPEFVAGHAASAGRPYLPDLARLEWTRADLFDAPDAAPVGRADLAGLPAGRAGEAVVRLVPAFALLRCRHDVAALWRALDEAPERSQPGPDGVALPAAVLRRALGRPTAVRVWRQGFVVFHRRIDEDEARDLEAVRAGDTLGALCQRIAAGLTPERATGRVGRRLQGWLDDGLIAGFDPPALG